MKPHSMMATTSGQQERKTMIVSTFACCSAFMLV